MRKLLAPPPVQRGTFSPMHARPPATVRADEKCSLGSKGGLIFTWSSPLPPAGTPLLQRTVAIQCPCVVMNSVLADNTTARSLKLKTKTDWPG